MSDLGNQIFLNTIQGGLEEILCHGVSAYPQPQYLKFSLGRARLKGCRSKPPTQCPNGGGDPKRKCYVQNTHDWGLIANRAAFLLNMLNA